MKNSRILAGDTFKTNEGGSVVVISYGGCYDVTVEHQDEYRHTSIVTASQLRSGAIKNPYRPRVIGFGFIGNGRHKASKNGKDTRPYVAWTKMLERAFSSRKHESSPSYSECNVIGEWLNFQNFADWYESQPFRGPGYQLDKDILKKGNKKYGPELCRLVPDKINKLLTGSDSRRGIHPIGVNFYAGKFCAHCSTDGKKNHLGRYETPELAFLAYKEFRESYIKRCAEDHKDLMPNEIYDALLAWKIDVND